MVAALTCQINALDNERYETEPGRRGRNTSIKYLTGNITKKDWNNRENLNI